MERTLGLTEKEVKERLKQFGLNVFWQELKFDWLRFLREELLNYFNIFLFLVFFDFFFWRGKLNLF
jgi:magnesium-transporting ATPase (P-type)